MLLAGIAPSLCDVGWAAGEILHAQQPKTRVSKQPFVLARRNEEIESDRTASRDLLVRHGTGDHHRIGEQSSSPGPQHTMPFAEDGESAFDVTHGVVR